MALYKINKPFNPEGSHANLYFGCEWTEKEDGIYVDVPDYAVEDYINSGRVIGVAAKEEPKLKDVEPKNMSAEDVVTGNTVAAAEKKEARAEKAAAAKAPVVKSKVKPKAKSKSKGK